MRSRNFMTPLANQVRREHRGWATNVTYRNFSGRNDIVAARRVGQATASFYVRTASRSRHPANELMVLFLDTDANVKTGWLGYDFAINRAGVGTLERNVGGNFAWSTSGKVKWRVQGNELELAIHGSARIEISSDNARLQVGGQLLQAATGPTLRSTATRRRTIGSIIVQSAKAANVTLISGLTPRVTPAS